MANFARLDLNRRLVMLRPINCSLVAGERAGTINSMSQWLWICEINWLEHSRSTGRHFLSACFHSKQLVERDCDFFLEKLEIVRCDLQAQLPLAACQFQIFCNFRHTSLPAQITASTSLPVTINRSQQHQVLLQWDAAEVPKIGRSMPLMMGDTSEELHSWS